MKRSALDPQWYDDVVADFYRAAAGEVSWNTPLERMVRMFDAFGAYLHGQNLSDGAVSFGYDVGGFKSEVALEYIRHYHRIDPRVALVAPAGVGDWKSCHEHFDERHVAADPFYQDFLIPYGGRYVSGAKIYQDQETVAFLGIHRGIGMQPLSADELAVGRRLGMHVGNALGLWRRQRELLRQVLVGNSVLERMSQPLLLVDEQMQLHYCSEGARRLVADEPRLWLRGNVLGCASRSDAAELSLALRALRLDAGFAEADASPRPSSDRLIVRLAPVEGRSALVLVLIALRSQETMRAFGPRNLALVLLHDVARRPTLDAFVVAAAFDLTPAEARVAVRIAAGDEVRAIARQHGTALATVRSQLRQVFSKVGVQRQAELAAALASLGAVVGESVAARRRPNAGTEATENVPAVRPGRRSPRSPGG